nr:hypothetical protein [Tanacetum cinerariifolium]
DENPIRTLRDYSKPSHEGYGNIIELPVGNNVIQIFYDHISFYLKYEIDHVVGDKLCYKTADESWKIIENLALYDHEGWNETKEFVKAVKAISTPQSTSKTPDRRLLELEDQINFLLNGSRLTPRPSSTHIHQAYAEAVYSNPHPKNQNKPPKQNLFTFHERTSPSPQPQALGTTFKARVRDYMAAHIKQIERLLKELMTSRALEKVLIREEAKFPVTKNEDEKRPFILGTPLLTMAKAVIKFDKGTITLRSGKSKISFHRIPKSLCNIERGVKNDIEPIAATMTVNRLVLEWEERIKLHLEREMKFGQWRSKNFKSKHHALVKVEGKMDDEGEVT